MAGRDRKLLALLPAVGLCSCAGATALEAGDPSSSVSRVAPGLIELEPAREPPSLVVALVRSGRESLAAGHYAAAEQAFSLALERAPERWPCNSSRSTRGSASTI